MLGLCGLLFLLGYFDLTHCDKIVEGEALTGVDRIEYFHAAFHLLDILLLLSLLNVFTLGHPHLHFLLLKLTVALYVGVATFLRLLSAVIVESEGGSLSLLSS